MDFLFTFEEHVRFRTNIYMQSRGLSLALRKIPVQVRSLKSLDAPQVLETIADFRRGLILVTGPTGSGKSTTLAAMVHQINLSRSDHVITIEDPIEYVHKSRQCLINQREIGIHALSFTDALRAAWPTSLPFVSLPTLRSVPRLNTFSRTQRATTATRPTGTTDASRYAQCGNL